MIPTGCKQQEYWIHIRMVKIAHVRPHDIVIEKSNAEHAAPATVKDWQHLGALIRLELVKNGANGSTAPVIAEMPNDQFKQLNIRQRRQG